MNQSCAKSIGVGAVHLKSRMGRDDRPVVVVRRRVKEQVTSASSVLRPIRGDRRKSPVDVLVGLGIKRGCAADATEVCRG